MNKPTALVLNGDGLNCEKEAAFGFRLAGFVTEIAHVRDVLSGKVPLQADVIHFPGGFLDGDDLGSAKALSDRAKSTQLFGKPFLQSLHQYVQDGGILYGACNGFQFLVKTGMLPGLDEKKEQTVSLTFNRSHKFEMRWVKLKVRKSLCPAFAGMENLELPVRHGEGRFTVYEPWGKIRSENGEKTLLNLFKNNQVIAQYANAQGTDTQHYPENPNGSIQAIAGICDTTGRIFGIMPHPEGFLRFENHPLWHRQKDALERQGIKVPTEGEGLAVFHNLYRFVEEKIK